MNQKRIIIRPLRMSDADDIHEIMHMPMVLWGTLNLPSKTLDGWHATIKEWLADEHTHVFVADFNGKVVGTISLWVGQGRASHTGRIAMAVHDAHQGQGIGNMLMLTVIDLADNWLNLIRLELEVFTDNERAIHLYKHFDFEIEGTKRCDAFRSGNFIDSYIMGRLHPQFLQTHAARTSTQDTQIPKPSNSPEAQQ